MERELELKSICDFARAVAEITNHHGIIAFWGSGDKTVQLTGEYFKELFGDDYTVDPKLSTHYYHKEGDVEFITVVEEDF